MSNAFFYDRRKKCEKYTSSSCESILNYKISLFLITSATEFQIYHIRNPAVSQLGNDLPA